MTKRLTAEDWKLWHEERQAFAARETEGFTKDLEALKEHILRLQAVAPKDNAGWPVTTALISLDKLKREYDRFVTIVANITSQN
jgi:hypothetical protein